MNDNSIGLLRGLSFSSISKGITKSQMEELIEEVNLLANSVNLLLKQEINLNQEQNDPSAKYSLSRAVNIAKNIRRAYGIRLRFLSLNGKYVEYSYIGTALDDDSWLNLDNWVTGVDVIDGGEF